MFVRNVPQISFFAAPVFLSSKEATTIVTRGEVVGNQAGLGPIPAHAGEPNRAAPWACTLRAYPRSRGGTGRRVVHDDGRLGLSPLTRGNPFSGFPSGTDVGPIPAHAGEPNVAVMARDAQGAYPRSRGGTGLESLRFPRRRGLSPLTRGNPVFEAAGHAAVGPIPAHAGEPAPGSWQSGRSWAYPRSRGGTAVGGFNGADNEGLSPLTRGNPKQKP